MCSSLEQVAPANASVEWLFLDQLGTWMLAVLETIAFVLACVDVFRYGPANRFMSCCCMLVEVLVCLLHSPRMEAWLLMVNWVEAYVEEETGENLECTIKTD